MDFLAGICKNKTDRQCLVIGERKNKPDNDVEERGHSLDEWSDGIGTVLQAGASQSASVTG